MKLRTKLFVGLLLLALLTAVTGIFGIKYTSDIGNKGDLVGNRLHSMTDAAMEASLSLSDGYLGFLKLMVGYESGQVEDIWKKWDTTKWYCNVLLEGGENADGTYYATEDEKVRSMIEETLAEFDIFLADAHTIYNILETGGTEELASAQQAFQQSYDKIVKLTSDSEELISQDMEDGLQRLEKQKQTAFVIMIIITLAAVLLAIIMGIILTRNITKPIYQVRDVADAIANGDLSVRVDITSDDEIGQLGTAINSMVTNLKLSREEMEENLRMGDRVIDEANRIAKIFTEEGDIEIQANPDIATGKYREMLEALNNLVKDLVSDMVSFIGMVGEFADGNFDIEIPDLPGKKMILPNTTRKMQKNIKTLIEETKSLAREAANGNLKARGNTDLFQGGYREIIDGVNQTLENIMEPTQQSVEVLQQMAGGDLSNRITQDFQGDFALMKNALNQTADSLNEILGQVNVAIEQVADGSRQVSDSSQALSQGATEQASSIEEVSSSLTEIGSMTRTNAENASQADQLAASTREDAEKGNQQMQQMLDSMKAINESSSEISRIIKVIDEIAFQTNLLALNAAVEAARAGVHGKGFAVVAEEVRNLAHRSATAAKETTELIEGSSKKVEAGTQIAQETAVAFGGILESITKVNDLANEIAAASKEQNIGIDQVSEALNQIEQITQSNTSSSEESAAAAEELSSQADHLKKMISQFKLRNVSYASQIGVEERRAISGPPDQSSSQFANDPGVEINPNDAIDLDDNDFLNF